MPAVSIPEDVCHAACAFETDAFEVDAAYTAVPALRRVPDRTGLARAAEMLGAARRPLILAGGGVHLSGAAGEVSRLVESLNLPVAHTMSGKRAIACTSPLSAGLLADTIALRTH